MTANPSLTPRERLDAMVETIEKKARQESCDGSLPIGWRIYPLTDIALSLLEKCDALEARIAEADKPCEWTRGEWDDFWSATCGKVAWEFDEGGPVENKVEFCPGCGHPVQVKQEEKDHPLDKCPQCGGPADNGFDRCLPPSPYFCTKCSAQQKEDSHD